MPNYRFIKDIVVETCMNEGGIPSYERLTALVRRHFPQSKWQYSHYAWYKSQIKTGKIAIPGLEMQDDLDLGGNDASEDELLENIDATISLEKDLHGYLAARVHEIENGLVIANNGIEYLTDAGRIDILANDNQGRVVVIELKAGKARDSALGQLLGYMGFLAAKVNQPIQSIRGILIASEFEDRVVFAAKVLPNVKLLQYKVSFSFQEIA